MATDLDYDEAANYLALDATTVAHFVKTGALHAANRRVSIADLEAFVERCRIKPGTLGSNNQPASRIPRGTTPRDSARSWRTR